MTRKSSSGLTASFIALALLAATSATHLVAGDTPMVKLPTKPLPVMGTARMTSFNPEVHGFRFINTFLNVTGVSDITTGGLCGGMVYAALDYFRNGIPAPRQDYTPAPGTYLESYIFGRQMKSLEAHIDKWLELHANPFGARNSEFFNWGLQGTGGGRLQELRAKIDAGQPVPLGLKSLSANPGEDHVVLAYGYDMGRYKGDLGAYKEDLKIFIYEPNFGARRVTLVPKPARSEWCYVERNHRGEEVCWRSYFVQQNYAQSMPPRIADNPVELVLDLKTGGDDLRGGNDNVSIENVSIEVVLADGRRIRQDNINRSWRWMGNSWNSVGISLPDTVRAGQVRSFSLKTSTSAKAREKLNLVGLVTAKALGDREDRIDPDPVKRATTLPAQGDRENRSDVYELKAALRVGGRTVQSCRLGSLLVRFDGNNRPLEVNFLC